MRAANEVWPYHLDEWQEMLACILQGAEPITLFEKLENSRFVTRVEMWQLLFELE
jgi:hypothetical protein